MQKRKGISLKAGIPWARPFLSKKERKFLIQAFDSGWLSDGRFVHKFESEFAKGLVSPFALTCCNGTAALQLALLGLGIGRGDEVIVPGYTFASVYNMVLSVGAKPVFADVDPNTWCLSPQEVLRKITQRTRAIVAVHLYGNVCDMNALLGIARAKRLDVIEDTAEACFSKYRGRSAGTFGDVGCFSFQAAKTITTGEGGCVLTARSGLFKRMTLIRNHGMRAEKRYWHNMVGNNFRMTNLQAAVGCGQLASAAIITRQRRRVFQAYREELKPLIGQGIVLQELTEGTEAVVWALAIKLDRKIIRKSRDDLITGLGAQGIECRPGFIAASRMPLYQAGCLPVCEEISRSVLKLPFYCELTFSQIEWICRMLRRNIKERRL